MAQPPGQKTRLARLHERDACTAAPDQPACRPLSRDERKRMDELDKQRDQVDAVTRFVPTLQKIYQVTLIDPDTMEHWRRACAPCPDRGQETRPLVRPASGRPA